MQNWNQIDMLEVVERYAEENGMIASEQELSDRFDSEWLDDVVDRYGEDDSVAINEEFSCYADALTKDGELHPEQYSHYCYVGRLADD